MGKNVVWQPSQVTAEERAKAVGQRGLCIWFTGLSGSGKSTLAMSLERKLLGQGVLAYVLDGDNLRHGISADLGFSAVDRRENMRRVGQLAKLFVDAGLVTLVAMISPYRTDRQLVQGLFGPTEFVEVYVDCPLDVCIARDVKGLFRRALAGEIPEFTGISAPYEPPEHADLTLNTGTQSLDTCTKEVLQLICARSYPVEAQ